MRFLCTALFIAGLLLVGCSRADHSSDSAEVNAATLSNTKSDTLNAAPRGAMIDPPIGAVAGGYRGFDRNTYPGDTAMQSMRDAFAFTGYWLTAPPGAHTNTWAGKRTLLKQQGWGFLVLANGRLDAEIVRSQRKGVTADALGKKDATIAVANARAEGFPSKSIIFLDQEEGGRLLPEQAAYLLSWTETIASSDYKPGVYASGQLVQDDPGVMIDTIRDIRDRVKKGKLHEIAMFDAQDTCPPAPGCTLNARPMSEAGEPDLAAWQYSQSPRRPEITKSCADTYAADGNCYAPNHPGLLLDMDLATSPDPSHGR